MNFHKQGTASIILKTGVFLNPAQVFNRDLSMLVASTFAKNLTPPIQVLEPMAASGIRSIRYYKQLGLPVTVCANDISPTAVVDIKQNFQNNAVEGEVTQLDALDLMYRRRGEWDIVDIDPYGSAASFLDGTIQAVKTGGLVCVTSTDVATLCGNHPDTCFYKYQSVPSKAKHCHQFALRILLYQMNAVANKYQKIVVPLVSISVDFYVRVFAQVIQDANEAKKSILKSSLVLQCSECPAYYFQHMGRQGKKRATVNFFKGPTVCPECGGELLLQGPIYSGKLHQEEFVDRLIEELTLKDYQTAKKIRGVLLGIKNQLEIPLSWDFSQLCKFFKATNPSQKHYRSALRSMGFRISQVHTKPGLYKTDALPEDVFDLFREWKRQKHSEEQYLGNMVEGSSAYRILSREKPGREIVFDWDLTEEEQQLLNEVRFPPNQRGWGPQPRPRNKKPEKRAKLESHE